MALFGHGGSVDPASVVAAWLAGAGLDRVSVQPLEDGASYLVIASVEADADAFPTDAREETKLK